MSECDTMTPLDMLKEWIERLGGTIPADGPHATPGNWAWSTDPSSAQVAGAVACADMHVFCARDLRRGSIEVTSPNYNGIRHRYGAEPDARAALAEIGHAVGCLVWAAERGEHWRMPILAAAARDELERIEQALRAAVA